MADPRLDVEALSAPSEEARGGDDAIHIDVSKAIGDVRLVLKGLSRIESSAVYPDLVPVTKASTVQELFSSLDESHGRLNKLGLFKTVVSNVHRGRRPGDVNVVFQFEEKTPSYSIGVTTNQKAEANIEVKGDVPGIFGTCNSASLQLNNSGCGSQKIAFSYFIPRNFGLPNFTSVFQLFASQRDFANYSSFSTKTKGVSFTMSDVNKRHQLTWEASVNDLYPVFNERRRASEAVLRHAGRSLKNALSYQYIIDDLRGEGIPSDGQCTQFKVEAGLSGGDRQFLKFDYGMLHAKLIRHKYIFHLNLSLGYMRPFGSLRNGISLLDRFHFTGNGGASTAFRGFGFRGVGPCDQGSIFDNESNGWQRIPEHIGGDCYGNLQLALHCPLKYEDYRLPLAFCFFNVGSLTAIEDRQPHENVYSHMFRAVRMSLGAGVSMSVAPGCWLEAFVAQPLLYAPTDTISRLQLGLRFKHNVM
ncbi:Sorting and assembly machinery component 50 -like protein [Babesia sp. Xinjiang]|uniref:Sorting and assembly machinery component 50 -like protein n=1 Tax=Babesia sp. Xinjiang TaxID=462227 RepID=UPI000A251B93|nr:Sorting and assembly machinery component 50 -like protein [Babesia sp. Xinjiang]ORM42127.1 Sorting and assembly machinery component 50 -like protein [Babesia sp. Xinjiang]